MTLPPCRCWTTRGCSLGIITIDDAIDVLTDESTEDMQKMAAILPDDEATTYFVPRMRPRQAAYPLTV